MTSILSSEDTRQTGVYRIRNTVNGRVYVGSAGKSFNARFVDHQKRLLKGTHFNKFLQRDWNKHGPLYFVFEIVERTDPRHAVAQEQVFMDFWKSYDHQHGYNNSPTAGSPLGMKHSEETRAKQSAFQRGRPKSQEHRNKIGAAHRGKKRSPATIAKLLASPRVVSQATRNKISAAHRNRGPMPQSTRDKISAAGRGRKHSPEVLKKIGDGNRGKVIPPAMRSAIAESLRGRKASPETKAKQSESQRRRHLDPKIKETHGKALRGRSRPQKVIDKIRLTKLRKQASLWDTMTHIQRRRFLWSHNRKTPQQIIDDLTKGEQQ